MEEIFKDKTVLITGGTGFIGRHLIKDILKFNPKSIRVLSRDELKHYDLKQVFTDVKVKSFIGDVRDYERLKRAMNGCDIVIHAAALKRIDLIEYNTEECIKTNILGTLNVVHACLETGVSKAVYISTDKACLPVNTYGASKFLGERIFIESNYSKGDHKTLFVCVRYGNVLESTGSLIPMIREKIIKNEDLTITDHKMTRFFITPAKAIALIFNSLKYGVGGEIFIPKPDGFKIIDVIQAIKDLYKYDKEIKTVGIRPGEKIHEVLVNSQEVPRTLDMGEFFVITSQIERYQSNIKHSYLLGKPSVNYQEYTSNDNLLSIDALKNRLAEIGVDAINTHND
ncbi:hypothetical protein COU60_00910 [Candidatus Pacearchaeota archaeon CG10_big_fil_rev_8_21_14_0_10_34_76]|nr:MAG: hypothetical protein COU60_00910 [Candidatus Pacearchaeota archaeon CG10_big_fil_rev_8_21_14_0_10_34_76]